MAQDEEVSDEVIIEPANGRTRQLSAVRPGSTRSASRACRLGRPVTIPCANPIHKTQTPERIETRRQEAARIDAQRGEREASERLALQSVDVLTRSHAHIKLRRLTVLHRSRFGQGCMNIATDRSKKS